MDKNTKKPVYKRVWFWIVAVIVLVIIFTPKGDNNTANNTDSQDNSSTNQVAEQAEPQKIDVKTLGDAFNANQVAAEEEWGGKYVEFSAEISNINEGQLSFHNVSSEEFSMTQIACRLKDKGQALNVQNGQTVTVRGVVGDQTFGVIDLKDCSVVR